MSTLKVNKITDTSNVEKYLAAAWVNFNGTGTVAIIDSKNIASLTDLGVGRYTLTFIDALPDANYAVVGASQTGGNTTSVGVDGAAASAPTLKTNTQLTVTTRNTAGTEDHYTVGVAVFAG